MRVWSYQKAVYIPIIVSCSNEIVFVDEESSQWVVLKELKDFNGYYAEG